VDPFAAVLFGGLFVFVAAVWLLGRLYPGSGMEQLGLRSAREITESREALEAEDLDQMLAARNARRRARGEPELTAAQLEVRVAQDHAEQLARRERYLADRDVQDLLDLTNARRRARGLPERTRADYERPPPEPRQDPPPPADQ
jgi:chromatin segregation and condensation protein Rec8/ScpA/Scc1 (kleisin family)